MGRTFITGAAGNLGGILAQSMARDGDGLRLGIHKKGLRAGLENMENVETAQIDLGRPETLEGAFRNIDCIVHFAGVLFMANPEKFLPVTNAQYFKNLLEAASKAGVKRVVLISFPHVEGETTPQNPARGRLDASPESVHARTRLEEERELFKFAEKFKFEGVSLRLGMVYGRGILMIDAARFFAKWRMLGIWKKPNYIHLVSICDFLSATKAAVRKPGIRGIYHIGDDGIQTLREFLDAACDKWRLPRPRTMPTGAIRLAASAFEAFSRLTGMKSPLTNDFITIGMSSYYGDTSRMKSELVSRLKYPTFKDGINTL